MANGGAQFRPFPLESPNMAEKTFEFDADTPGILHMDQDTAGNDVSGEVLDSRYDAAAAAVADLIEATFRDIHGKSQDDKTHICGGCALNVVQNGLIRVLMRGGLGRLDAATYLRDAAKGLFQASLEIDSKGGLLELLDNLENLAGGSVRVEVIDLGSHDGKLN
jgi:hypothetical protein